MCKLSFRAWYDRHDKLSWEDTFRAMRAANEDWSDLDPTVSDGLD